MFILLATSILNVLDSGRKKDRKIEEKEERQKEKKRKKEKVPEE